MKWIQIKKTVSLIQSNSLCWDVVILSMLAAPTQTEFFLQTWKPSNKLSQQTLPNIIQTSQIKLYDLDASEG